MRKKCMLLGVLISIILFITGCGCSGGDIIADKETKRKPSTGESWTVMIYMVESSLEEKYNRVGEVLSSLSYDLPENINVIVEIGGCKENWSIEEIKNDKIQDFAVQKNGIRLIAEKELANMGESDTYSSFISRTVKKYPADRYISVIWGDGGGYVNGAAHDVVFGKDALTSFEIAEALKKTGQKLDIIGFDSNLMSDVETAYVLAPYADYMVASQDVIPLSGWDYRALFKFISETPSESSEKVCKNVCDAVAESASKEYEEQVSMSVVDLSVVKQIEKEFEKAVDGMLLACEDMDTLCSMTALINSAPCMGANTEKEGYSNLVDIRAFAEAVSVAGKCDTSALEEAIEKAVVYRSEGEFHAETCGLNVFYPKQKTPQEINRYKKTSHSEKYKEYIDKTTASASITGRVADYRDTGAWKMYSEISDDYINAEPDLTGEYLLSASNTDAIINIGVNLYKYNEEEGLYLHLHTDKDIHYNNITNTFENELKSKQLEMNGISVDAYHVTTIGTKSIYSIPVIYDDVVSSLRVMQTIGESEDKRTYKVLGIWENASDRKYKVPSSGDTVTPIYKAYGGSGNSYVEGKSLTLVFGGLNIKEKDLDDGEYIISYITEDLYGKKTESNTTNVKAIKGKMQVSK